MSSHTPGPWRNEHVCGDDPNFATDIISDYKSKGQGYPCMIAAAFFDDDDAPQIGPLEAEANARLMAAAPELLAALELYVEKDSQVDIVVRHDMALTALKKARGL